jgi:hypothetical protein
MNEDEVAQALLSAPFVPGHKGKEKPSLLDIVNSENGAMPSVGILESQNTMDGSEEDGSKSQAETRLEQTAPGKWTFFFGKKNVKENSRTTEDKPEDEQAMDQDHSEASDEVMEDIDPIAGRIIDTPVDHLKHLLVPFDSIGDKAAFFRAHKKFFACGVCRSMLRGDGYANGTYRLKCHTCKSSVSLGIALGEVKDLIKLCHSMESFEEVEATTVPTKKKRGPMGATASSSDEEAPQVDVNVDLGLEDCRTFEDLKSMVISLMRENKVLLQEVGRLTRIVTALTANQQMPVPSEPAARRVEYSKVVASGPTASTAAATAPKGARGGSQQGKVPREVSRAAPVDHRKDDKPATPGPKGKHLPRVYTKDLTAEEFQKLFNGQPIRPPKRIMALYVNKGLGQTKRISELRHILKVYAGMEMRNILHIDYVGKSVMEFHLYDDYLTNFKAIAAEKFPQWEVLDGLDPLSDSLLKRSILNDKVALAAEKYRTRLSKRLKSTPSAAHRRFLEKELARADKILQAPTEMQVDSSATTCSQTSTTQC